MMKWNMEQNPKKELLDFIQIAIKSQDELGGIWDIKNLLVVP